MPSRRWATGPRKPSIFRAITTTGWGTALGFFPVFLIKEVLLRVTPLRRGGWFYFLVLSVVMAIAAVYELIEWWSTYLVAGDVGQAFLGSQGDPWDAQWDMFLALVGAVAGLLLLGRVHDRSMARSMAPSMAPSTAPSMAGAPDGAAHRD
jgi:putative membrane protein